MLKSMLPTLATAIESTIRKRDLVESRICARRARPKRANSLRRRFCPRGRRHRLTPPSAALRQLDLKWYSSLQMLALGTLAEGKLAGSLTQHIDTSGVYELARCLKESLRSNCHRWGLRHGRVHIVAYTRPLHWCWWSYLSRPTKTRPITCYCYKSQCASSG